VPSLAWPGWAVLGLIAIAGVFDASGNTFYTVATRLGRLDIAAVLSSLYPASTILLAALILKERTTGSQTAGMALALVAVALISA
jgi:drug/metabolite transporter (DMT)-like permease